MNMKILNTINTLKQAFQEDQKDPNTYDNGDWIYGITFDHSLERLRVDIHMHADRFAKLVPEGCSVKVSTIESGCYMLEYYNSTCDVWYVTVVGALK